jgi:serine/threonine protein phosphatase PrpC
MSAIDPKSIASAALSVVGRVRSENQDYCAEFERADGSRLLVVADGMGGHNGGATASRVATEAIGEFYASSSLDSPDLLREAVAHANQRVFQRSLEESELRGMGTTVVVILFDKDGLVWAAHVGDSRLYRLNSGEIEQLTQDHSVVGEMVRRGLISQAEAQVHPNRNEILRSVGIDGDVETDVAQVEAAPGDFFLLCSDGLTGMVSDREIASVVNLEPLEEATQSLIDFANDRGGTDNITVMVASLEKSSRSGGETVHDQEVTPAGARSRGDGQAAATTSNSWLIAGIAAALFVILAIYFALGSDN